MTPPARLLCLGYGYVAAEVARRLREDGWTVAGTSRTATKAKALAEEGVEGVVFDGSPSAALAEALGRTDAILISTPPGPDGDPTLAAHLDAVKASPARWVGYLSTTGVFGDRAGGWAFEWDPPLAQSPEAERRAAAEAAWLATGLPMHVFRLPGIYGPGRSAFDRLRSGSANRVVKAGQVFSRAHRDDIATAVLASLRRPNPGRVYAICDDEPAPPQDVITHAAALLGIEPPPEVPFEEADLSPMARRFYGESKRVSNARAKAEIGWMPAYPTYREGLAAILSAGG